MLPKVILTPAAAKFINRVVRFSGMGAGAGLRLAITPGGCSGYASEFSAQTAPEADEKMLETGSVRLFLAAQSRQLLNGLIIDFVETATESGLTFTDPHKEACVCSSAAATPKPGVTRIEISAISRGRPSAPVLTA